MGGEAQRWRAHNRKTGLSISYAVNHDLPEPRGSDLSASPATVAQGISVYNRRVALRGKGWKRQEMIEEQPLWAPGEDAIATSNLTRFINFLARHYGAYMANSRDLHAFSVRVPEVFWPALW